MHAHGKCRASCIVRGRWSEPYGAVLAVITAVLCHCVRLTHGLGFRGIVEGDTKVEVYINSIYIRSDTVSPVLPFNSQRRYYYDAAAGAWAIRLDNPLVPGDVIGLKASGTLAEFVPVRHPIGTVIDVPGRVAVIAAFEDGTMTNTEWKCTDDWEDGWHAPLYNDTDWPFAIVHPRSSAPWRDPTHAWKRLNSEWIGPPLNNLTGPRSFVCRYIIQDSPRIMDGSELKGNDTAAPTLTMLSMDVGSAVTQVKFTLSRRARVSCELVDTRYELRTPTPLELYESAPYLDLNALVSIWRDVTGNNAEKVDRAAALLWTSAISATACREECEAFGGHPTCTAISFWDVGQASNGHNCKLMAAWNGTMDLVPGARLTHMTRETRADPHKMSITGLLLPGTLYTAYCVATDLNTGVHTSWQRIGAMGLSNRTAGCFDCGEQDRPVTTLLGGYATRDSILAVVQSSQPGRVICLAREIASFTEPYTLTIPQVKAVVNFTGLISRAYSSASVVMTGLRNNTLHEVGCMGQTDSGTDSADAVFNEQLRRWYTEDGTVPLEAMEISSSIYRNELTINMRARMNSIGNLWCQVFDTPFVEQNGVPDQNMLKVVGRRLRVKDFRQDAGGVFAGLFTNTTYELFCSAQWSDFRNDTEGGDDFAPDYPVVSILRWTIGYDEVTLILNVDKGPATCFCRAMPWSRRPFTRRPSVPEREFMQQSSFRTVIQDPLGGDTIMVLTGLDSGWWHDIFCYSEEWKDPGPPGSTPPAVRGMTSDKIRATRLKIKTNGPEAKDGSWHCISGNFCGISDLLGDGLSSIDKVMARPDQCPGRCLCSGDEDLDRKGATCSPVSHSRLVNPPEPGMDLNPDDRDPRGPWCYVLPGACADEEQSPTFPNQLISYQACIFINSTLDRPGIGPPGFPDNGLATPADSTGSSYFWSGGPLVAPGLGYSVCWCNGTDSPCAAVSDFRLRVGIMDLSGPSSEQAATQMDCIAGEPCTLRYFKGYGLANGNRLVPVPLTVAGCNWERSNPAEPLAPPGFPNNGITLPATHDGRQYTWGTSPVIAAGGLYVLCWCGTLAANGSSDCPLERPVDGSHFLAPGGTLAVAGPRTGTMFFCDVGIECTIQGVPGYGLQGGDLVAILEECGKPMSAPLGWTTGLQEPLFQVPVQSNLSAVWGEGGWLAWGPDLTDDILNASASPLHAELNDTKARGAWGFPNNGMSLPDPRVGYYGFGAPVQALPGDYALCWCGSEVECSSPTQFRMLVGVLRLGGPASLPGYSQVFNCIRNRACEVNNVEGVWPTSGGQLFIADARCGSARAGAVGVPRNGISNPSQDGRSFSWGKEAVISPPGRYRLCWCASLVNCDFGDTFLSFVGIMQIKAPFGPERRFMCAVGAPCLIEQVYGIGSSPNDRVMVMTVCEHGIGSDGFEDSGKSKHTGEDGTWFEMPVARSAGQYRVCWCAGETLCIRGVDYSHDLGMLIVGGPDRSVLYKCHEWAPCSIDPFIGRDFQDGDRLLVVNAGTDCQQNITTLALAVAPGFPLNGYSQPASNAGKTHSWGSDKVRTPPGVYNLCWCSVLTAPLGICDEMSQYPMMGGALEVATAREYMYMNRPEDPEDRGKEDNLLIYLLAIPTVGLFLATTILGWRKMTVRQQGAVAQNPFPQKKAWAAVEQEKARTFHAVQQVMHNRMVALGQLKDLSKASITEEEIPQYRVSTADGKRPKALTDVPRGPSPLALEDEERGETRIARMDLSAGSKASQRRGLFQMMQSALGSDSKSEDLAVRGVRRQTPFDPYSVPRGNTPPERGNTPPAGKRRGPSLRSAGSSGSRPRTPEDLLAIADQPRRSRGSLSSQRSQGLQRQLSSDSCEVESMFGDLAGTGDGPEDTIDTDRASVVKAKEEAKAQLAALTDPAPPPPGGLNFTPFADPRRRDFLLRVLDL